MSSKRAVANSSKATRRTATITSHLAADLQPDLQPSSSATVVAMTQGDVENTMRMYNTHNHSLLTALHEAKGDVFTLVRDGQPVVFVRDPAGIKQVPRTA